MIQWIDIFECDALPVGLRIRPRCLHLLSVHWLDVTYNVPVSLLHSPGSVRVCGLRAATVLLYLPSLSTVQWSIICGGPDM
ncbi:hypothetical protein GDO78_009069 [Eleutherodactylus coqui]|uniref:Uncharacterized protein n=1 Tax=Eleutherodactylus coqui TaxID=57060 RepID=A0A8J6F9D5_ELECQ|nr:hypothetical protein GDO78_009069 [Eleutherodactylus coqui]